VNSAGEWRSVSAQQQGEDEKFFRQKKKNGGTMTWWCMIEGFQTEQVQMRKGKGASEEEKVRGKKG